MNIILLALLAVAVLAIALVASRAKWNKAPRVKPTRRGTPLTKNEQPMYFRLRETFPDDIVLAQVSFSALLMGKRQQTRNTFDRKVADFVLCTKGFAVVAVIELDDSSHRDKGAADAARDSLLTDAGYLVLRFTKVPDAQELRLAVPPHANAPL